MTGRLDNTLCPVHGILLWPLPGRFFRQCGRVRGILLMSCQQQFLRCMPQRVPRRAPSVLRVPCGFLAPSHMMFACCPDAYHVEMSLPAT